MIKWFDEATIAVNNLAEGGGGSSSFTLDDGTATTDGVFVMDDGGA
jgi:hypothetical protein